MNTTKAVFSIILVGFIVLAMALIGCGIVAELVGNILHEAFDVKETSLGGRSAYFLSGGLSFIFIAYAMTDVGTDDET